MEKLMIKNVLTKFGPVLAGLIFASTAPQARGQEPLLPPVGAVEVERVIVTGSNIPTAQEETSLPVTTYTAQFLQKAGAGTPVEGLRQLPTFVGNSMTEMDSNGGSGAAAVNLRGLGPENVLILINNRRAFLSSTFDGGVDVNMIPISALQRVEVLKDGASSIYGSDAVAGVVNFLMYNGPGTAPYEGAEFELRYGTTTDSDANERQAWIRGGVTGLDGKVQIFASAEYYNRAALMSIDRTIAATGDVSNNPNIGLNPDIGVAGLGLGGFNGNSPTFGGKIFISGAWPDLSPTGTMTLFDLSNNSPAVANYRPFDIPAGRDPNRFNFRAFTPAIPAIEKSSEYVSGRYKVFGDALQVYGDMLYTHYRQSNALAGAPFNIGRVNAQTSIFNPFPIDDREFLPNGLPNSNFGNSIVTNASYRLQQELGNRTNTFDKDQWRWVVGVNGDIPFADNGFISRFGYDTGITYERFDAITTFGGDATFTGITNEIAAGNFNPFIGQNASTSGVAPIYNTTDPAAPEYLTGVPIGTAAFDNTAAANRAAYLGHGLFHQKDFIFDISVNADLFPNLWNGGIGVAGGYQRQWQQQHSIPDPVQAQGDQLGFNAAPNNKLRQEVNAWFAEVKIPLVTSTMNVPLIYNLGVDYAFRFEEFDVQDLTNPSPHESASFDNGGNSRVTVRYQPIPDLLLRGTWGESFRSPSPADLFFPVFQNFPVVFDPVAGSTFQPPEGVWERGNPALQPENTTNWTAGLVYSPKFVPGLTVSADWYQIYTTDLILSATDFSQVLLTQNVIDPDGYGNGSGIVDDFGPFTGQVGGTGLGVTRDDAGNLVAIDSVATNAGIRFVQGLDIQASYQLPTTNFGQFTFTLGYNHFFTWKASIAPGTNTIDFLGNYNNGTLPLAPGAIPFNKGFLRLEWEYKLGPGLLDFVAQGNYIGDFDDDPSFIADNVIISGDEFPAEWALSRRVTSYETLDLQASYEFVRPEMPAPVPGFAKEGKDFKSAPSQQVAGAVETGTFWQRMLWGTKVTAGVVNAFDRNPPTVLGAFNDSYDTSLYTIRNRFWYVALNKKF
jgi:iron complex outermembrane receptor protein